MASGVKLPVLLVSFLMIATLCFAVPASAQMEPNDTDNDGLPDTWEMNQFGNLDQGAYDDPDGDLFDNLDEYNAGTDPNDSESSPLDFGLDILGTVLFWIAVIVIVVIVAAVLIFFVFIKAVSDEVDRSSAPPPVYYQPPPPPMYQGASFCPYCGQSFAEQAPVNGQCPKCGGFL